MNSRNTKLKPFAIFGGLIASLLLFSGIIISHAFTDHLSLGKTFFYFFTLSFLCAWFFIQHIFLPGKKSISFNLTDVLMCFFTVYILIRVFTTPSISMLHHSFIIFGGYVVIYFIVRNVFSMYSNHEKSQEDFLYAFMLLALMVFIVQIVAGFLQLSGVMEGYHKLFAVTGFFHNPGPFAIFLTGLSPFILGFILLKYPFAFFRYLAWACLGGFLVLLVISKSRSAWIAFTIGLIFFIYYTGVYPLSIKKWLTKPSNKILVPGIALLFIIISGYGLFHLKKESVLGRAFVWKITLHAIADKPVFGSGFSQFQKTHNDYQATYFRQGKGTEKEINMATDDPYAYNEYIQMACELGMIGLILFILFILSLFIHRPLKANTQNHKIQGIAKTSVLMVAISALFSYPFHVIPIAVILFIAAGIISGLNNNTIFSKTIPVKYIRLTSVVGFILVFMFMHYQYKQLHAYKNWKKGYDLLRAGKVNAGLQVYNKLHEPLRHDGSFLFNYGSELSILNRHKKSAKVLNETIALLNVADVYTYLGNSYEGMEQYNRAIAAFEQSSYIIPHKFYPKYRLLPLYFGTGQKRKAIELARSMLHTEPKVPSKIVDKIKYDVRGFLEKYE